MGRFGDAARGKKAAPAPAAAAPVPRALGSPAVEPPTAAPAAVAKEPGPAASPPVKVVGVPKTPAPAVARTAPAAPAERAAAAAVSPQPEEPTRRLSPVEAAALASDMERASASSPAIKIEDGDLIAGEPGSSGPISVPPLVPAPATAKPPPLSKARPAGVDEAGFGDVWDATRTRPRMGAVAGKPPVSPAAPAAASVIVATDKAASSAPVAPAAEDPSVVEVAAADAEEVPPSGPVPVSVAPPVSKPAAGVAKPVASPPLRAAVVPPKPKEEAETKSGGGLLINLWKSVKYYGPELLIAATAVAAAVIVSGVEAVQTWMAAAYLAAQTALAGASFFIRRHLRLKQALSRESEIEVKGD